MTSITGKKPLGPEEKNSFGFSVRVRLRFIDRDPGIGFLNSIYISPFQTASGYAASERKTARTNIKSARTSIATLTSNAEFSPDDTIGIKIQSRTLKIWRFIRFQSMQLLRHLRALLLCAASFLYNLCTRA